MSWQAIEEERKAQIANNIAESIRQDSPQIFNGDGKVVSGDIEQVTVLITKRIEETIEVLPFERKEFFDMISSLLFNNCLLATEAVSINQLKESLQSLKQFQGWNFITCTDAQGVFQMVDKNPDVLVVSHSLPGLDQRLLASIQTLYPNSRIVLLAGIGNETFINMANGYGLNNYVTGDIPATPGDRPYTLPVALVYDRSFVVKDKPTKPTKPTKTTTDQANIKTKIEPVVKKQACIVQSENIPKINIEKPVEVEPTMEAHTITVEPTEVVKKQDTKKKSEPAKQVQVSEIASMANKEEESIAMINDYMENIEEDTQLYARSTTFARGKLILFTSSKGGVGKTTLTVMAGISLAKSGVKTTIVDLNLGAPNCHTFFKVKKDVPGIEFLANKPFSKTIIDDVLCKINDYLYLLPGPMDQTSPYFEPGKLGAIIDYLLETSPVVLIDTAPEFWEDKRLREVFKRADKVYSILSQDAFTEEEARVYAPKYVMYGVSPDKIGLIIGMYDPDLQEPKKLEKSFNTNIIVKDKKKAPKIEALIPVNTREYKKGTYEGKIAAVERSYNQIHLMATHIAEMAGYSYQGPQTKEKKEKGFFNDFLGRFKRR
ncbi:AAA family ATPase [Desulfofalx alkaliphila]|uniref:AAA family ATPase n=1 Tax=Desulfofalx alkaliphila TaxID=105483 RepID=UPI0004E26E58|nr:ParA family protein [Desulfofalx alkaliphila]